MAWHLSLVHASGPRARLGVLPTVGLAPLGKPITVDEAIAGLDDVAPDGVGATTLAGGDALLVVAPFLPDSALAAALSADGGHACWALWQGVTDSYAFSSFRSGAQVRQLVRAAGETVINEGAPLPEEASLDWSDGEAALFLLAAAVTGLPLGSDEWVSWPVEVHRLAPRPPDVSPLSLGSPPKKKRWFTR